MKKKGKYLLFQECIFSDLKGSCGQNSALRQLECYFCVLLGSSVALCASLNFFGLWFPVLKGRSGKIIFLASACCKDLAHGFINRVIDDDKMITWRQSDSEGSRA